MYIVGLLTENKVLYVWHEELVPASCRAVRSYIEEMGCLTQLSLLPRPIVLLAGELGVPTPCTCGGWGLDLASAGHSHRNTKNSQENNHHGNEKEPATT